MAKGSFLGLLAWALPMQLAGTCLRCWPDAVTCFGYDAYLLLGQDSDATRRLVELFLGSAGDLASNGRRYLERDHMEREAGNLFLHLEKIIRTNGKDHERLMREAEQEKQNFVKRLDEASHAFMKEICSLSCAYLCSNECVVPLNGGDGGREVTCGSRAPIVLPRVQLWCSAQSRYRSYEVARCINCQLLKVPCNDPVVCAGTKVLTGVLVTFLILLGIAAVVWYRRRKKKAEGEAKDQEDDDKESSESSEESEEAVPNSEELNVSNGPTSSFPSSPAANIPSPPPFEIPSPPPFDIPSPPPFDDTRY